MMLESEYRTLSADLRVPYDAAMTAWSGEQNEINKARVFRKFDHYNNAQQQLFETYCRIGEWPNC